MTWKLLPGAHIPGGLPASAIPTPNGWINSITKEVLHAGSVMVEWVEEDRREKSIADSFPIDDVIKSLSDDVKVEEVIVTQKPKATASKPKVTTTK